MNQLPLYEHEDNDMYGDAPSTVCQAGVCKFGNEGKFDV